ncbi:MAG: cupin domain-containing protein [Rhizobiaceae bacterium]|nr:cupin domain-containing protein [Rhizobiaceae bacterium]
MNRRVAAVELSADAGRVSASRGGRRSASVKDLPEVRIGAYLKHARLAKRLRLKELAAEVGCTESFLSKVENNKVRPSLSVLHRLVVVLDIDIAALFDPEQIDAGPVSVTRAGERPVVKPRAHAGSGLVLERIVSASPLIEASVYTIDPGCSGENSARREGEEVGYVLQGEMELTVEGRSYRLGKGDTFFFRSTHPHAYRNSGTANLSVLWINTPPSI